MNVRIAVLPGDGIGPEVTKQALNILSKVCVKANISLETVETEFGGRAIDLFNDPFPAKTKEICDSADAVLLGAVGGPKWSDPNAKVRPEQGLLELRSRYSLFANLRPIKVWDSLLSSSPLRQDIVKGADILFVRELTGGLYFGKRQDGEESAFDTMEYSKVEIERVVRAAAELAMKRKKRLMSIDKANVLASSRLWRKTTERIIKNEYPELTLEHQLVDSAAMRLIQKPTEFDTAVTENMFGDILTDEASVLSGSLGLLPSASIGDRKNALGYPFGVYEPIHGSAPDIAGKGLANPIGTILSAAMLLRYSLGLSEPADAIETAVNLTLNAGYRTKDLSVEGTTLVDTETMGSLIAERI